VYNTALLSVQLTTNLYVYLFPCPRVSCWTLASILSLPHSFPQHIFKPWLIPFPVFLVKLAFHSQWEAVLVYTRMAEGMGGGTHRRWLAELFVDFSCVQKPPRSPVPLQLHIIPTYMCHRLPPRPKSARCLFCFFCWLSAWMVRNAPTGVLPWCQNTRGNNNHREHPLRLGVLGTFCNVMIVIDTLLHKKSFWNWST
jgi:hypothetical protein